MLKITLLLFTFISQTVFAQSECVIMVHGMWRSGGAMEKLSNVLRKEGYYVVNKTYATQRYSIQYVADLIVPEYVAECEAHQATKIHFVTHSIGGLIVRAYLDEHTLPVGSRIVMLAPPNHGSILADKLHRLLTYRAMMGQMGQELQTGQSGASYELPQNLPYEVGIITGDSWLNPISAHLLKEKNDGKVTITSAKLSGMRDFMVVPISHTFIMKSPQVIQASLYFLRHGHFKPS